MRASGRWSWMSISKLAAAGRFGRPSGCAAGKLPAAAYPKKAPFDCRFSMPSLVFIVEPGLQTSIRKHGPVVGAGVVPGQTRMLGGCRHEYLSPDQPDRLLRRQHRLGIVQHSQVRAPPAFQIKAQVADRSLACDGLKRGPTLYRGS